MKIQAAILDWAGTVVDHGSRAPMGAFVRAFAQFGVAISIADARGPMGMAKWDHIRAVGQTPSVAVAWRARHGRDFSEGDVDAIFQVFEPMNIAAVRDHADIIPGALAAIDALRARGIRIAGTTGYTRPIMDVLEPLAAAAGYAPELTVCAGDLPAGRPTPLMMWYAMAKLGVWPAAERGEGGRHRARYRRRQGGRNVDGRHRADGQCYRPVSRGTGRAVAIRAYPVA